MLIQMLKKSFIKLLLVSISMLVLMIPFFWLQISHPQKLHTVAAFLTRLSTLWTVLRWSLIIAFIGGWPRFIRYYAKKNEWMSEKTQFWLAQRFRISAWLIIFELLVCENILLVLLKAI